MRDEVRGAFGRLDCFVANAGIWQADEVPLVALPADRWRATMAANLDAVFLSTRAALELMGPGGRVVIVSSTAGQRGGGPPGWSTTFFSPPLSAPHARERVRGTIPLRRIPPPEDIAGPILFLCSDLARHLTGEVLNVNGGSVLCG